jgi:hypothetical protein
MSYIENIYSRLANKENTNTQNITNLANTKKEIRIKVRFEREYVITPGKKWDKMINPETSEYIELSSGDRLVDQNGRERFNIYHHDAFRTFSVKSQHFIEDDFDIEKHCTPTTPDEWALAIFNCESINEINHLFIGFVNTLPDKMCEKILGIFASKGANILRRFPNEYFHIKNKSLRFRQDEISVLDMFCVNRDYASTRVMINWLSKSFYDKSDYISDYTLNLLLLGTGDADECDIFELSQLEDCLSEILESFRPSRKIVLYSFLYNAPCFQVMQQKNEFLRNFLVEKCIREDFLRPFLHINLDILPKPNPNVDYTKMNESETALYKSDFLYKSDEYHELHKKRKAASI